MQDQGPDGRGHPSVRRLIAVLVLGTASVSLLQSATVPAIPEIARAFDTDAAGGAWIMSSFLLSAAVCTPLFGRLGDMYGKRRMLVICLLVFLAGNVMSALAESFGVLIAGRVVQGAGYGLFPIGYALLRDL